MPEIKVIDTTLRDAHQSLWATRMTTAMMIPVAEKMDRAGFEAIDLKAWEDCDGIVVARIQMDKTVAPHLKKCRIIVEVNK